MTKSTQSIFQAVLVAAIVGISWVSAQGHMTYPVPMQGDSDIMGYSNNLDACGVSLVQPFKYTEAMQRPTMSIYPGQSVGLNYAASGPLGFGPLYVRFDSIGNGKAFDYMAQMTGNLAGNMGYLAQSPSNYYPYNTNVTFTVPAAIKCNNNLCLMQVLNQQGYVSCTFVRLTVVPVTPVVPAAGSNTGATTLYGGTLVQAKLERLDALVDILKNLGVDAKILFQANFDVQDLIKRLVSIIN